MIARETQPKAKCTPKSIGDSTRTKMHIKRHESLNPNPNPHGRPNPYPRRDVDPGLHISTQGLHEASETETKYYLITRSPFQNPKPLSEKKLRKIGKRKEKSFRPPRNKSQEKTRKRAGADASSAGADASSSVFSGFPKTVEECKTFGSMVMNLSNHMLK